MSLTDSLTSSKGISDMSLADSPHSGGGLERGGQC
jgi:hypothetical protein